MRLPNYFIATALLVSAVSAKTALGQWTQTATTPIYSSAVPAYTTGAPTLVQPMVTAAPVYATSVPASTPYYGVAPATSLSQPSSNQLLSNGAYQAQRPTYLDNPSVYTGQPTRGSVQATNFAAAQAPTYTGSQPVKAPTNNVVTAYSAPANATPITAPPITAPPITAPTPSTVNPANYANVAPAYASPSYAAAPPKRENCLSRLCNKLFGTGYTSSYYRAPVTYYRPVVMRDATTGRLVTVQQPCTSYEQQVQRSPFTTLLPGTANAVNPYQPSCPCPPGFDTCTTTSPYGQGSGFAQVMPNPQATYNGIGQVNATTSGDFQSVPIPSIPPSAPQQGQNTTQNLTPLTGAPPILSTPNTAESTVANPQTGSTSNDLDPVQPPALNKPPVTNPPVKTPPIDLINPNAEEGQGEDPTVENATQENDSAQWRLQRPADSTAMIPRKTSGPTRQDPVSLKRSYGVAEPIRAPADYVAPYGPNESVIEHGVTDQEEPHRPSPSAANPFTAPPSRESSPLQAPALPIDSADASDWTNHSTTPAVPVRIVSYEQLPRETAPTVPRRRSRQTVWTSIAK